MNHDLEKLRWGWGRREATGRYAIKALVLMHFGRIVIGAAVVALAHYLGLYGAAASALSKLLMG